MSVWLQKIGFDTAENEPCEVCLLSVNRLPTSLETIFEQLVFHLRPSPDHYFGSRGVGAMSGAAAQRRIKEIKELSED